MNESFIRIRIAINKAKLKDHYNSTLKERSDSSFESFLLSACVAKKTKVYFDLKNRIKNGCLTVSKQLDRIELMRYSKVVEENKQTNESY